MKELKQRIIALEKENAELKQQLEARHGKIDSICFSLKEFGGERVQYVFQPNDSLETFWSLTRKSK